MQITEDMSQISKIMETIIIIIIIIIQQLALSVVQINNCNKTHTNMLLKLASNDDLKKINYLYLYIFHFTHIQDSLSNSI